MIDDRNSTPYQYHNQYQHEYYMMIQLLLYLSV